MWRFSTCSWLLLSLHDKNWKYFHVRAEQQEAVNWAETQRYKTNSYKSVFKDLRAS